MTLDLASSALPDGSGDDASGIVPRTIITTLGQIPGLLRCDPVEPEGRRIRNAQNTARFLECRPEWVGRAPSMREVESALRAFVKEAARHGMTHHRAESIASSVRSAIRWSRRGNRSGRARVDLHPAWDALLAQLTKTSDRIAIGTFAAWMSARGLLPHQTTDIIVTQYREHRAEEGKARPQTAMRSFIHAWNRARESNVAWPTIALAMPPSLQTGTRTSEFAPEFIADLEAYAAAGQNPSAPQVDSTGRIRRYNAQVSTGRRHKKRRPETMRNYARMLRRAAVLLSQSRQQPLTNIKSLRELVQPGVAETVMEEYAHQHGEGPTQRNMLQALRDVVTTYVAMDAAVLQEIMALLRQVPTVRMEMSDKNRALLHGIEVDDLTRLFSASDALRKEVDKKVRKGQGLGRRDIVLARVAVCLAILLYVPIRISNLANVRLGKNLHIPQKVGQLGRFAFSADETKSKREFSAPVGGRTLEMVRWYREVILEKIAPGTDVLFPSDTIAGLPIETQTLRSCLINEVQRLVGLRLHPHFYRHLVAHLILVRHPDQIEAVAKLLGHADSRVTRAYYASDAAQAALRRLAHFLEQTTVDLRDADFDPADWLLDGRDPGEDISLSRSPRRAGRFGKAVAGRHPR